MGNNIARRDRLGKQKEKMRSEEEPRSSRRRNPAKSYYAKSTTRHTDKSKLPDTNFSACGMLDGQVRTSFVMSRKTKNRKGSVNEFTAPLLWRQNIVIASSGPNATGGTITSVIHSMTPNMLISGFLVVGVMPILIPTAMPILI